MYLEENNLLTNEIQWWYQLCMWPEDCPPKMSVVLSEYDEIAPVGAVKDWVRQYTNATIVSLPTIHGGVCFLI